MAIAPVVSPERSLEIYHEFVSYLAARVSMEPQFLQRQTYAEVNDLVRYNQCDLAFVCTYAFVRGEREFQMKLLAAPQIKGVVSYRSLIIVRHSSQATSLLDLKDRIFASADVLSTSGWLYPATWLIENGIDPKRFFSNHVITGSHDRSILSVISGDVDGAAVDSIVYERISRESPEISAQTRVIQQSSAYGTPPMVVNPQIDPQLKARLLKVLTGMDQDEEGRRVLSHLGIDRFVVAVPEAYDGVRTAAALWERQP